MENCPFSSKQIQLGIQEVGEESSGETLSFKGADSESESVFKTQKSLLGMLQNEFESRLPELLTAAYNPDYNGIELVGETDARYLFRVTPGFWVPIKEKFEIGDVQLRIVHVVYEQFVSIPDGWRPLLVSKPNPYENGKKAVAAELRALESAGMDSEDAVSFITRKHGIGPSLNPYVMASGKDDSEWGEVPAWQSDIKRQSRVALLRTPSGIRVTVAPPEDSSQ